MKYFSLHTLQSILPVSTDLKTKVSWPSHKRRYFQLLADSLKVHIIFHTHTPSNLSGVWAFHYQRYFTIYPSLLFQVPVFNTETIDFIQSIKEHSNTCWLRTYSVVRQFGSNGQFNQFSLNLGGSCQYPPYRIVMTIRFIYLFCRHFPLKMNVS